jgi:hypothetical protein
LPILLTVDFAADDYRAALCGLATTLNEFTWWDYNPALTQA